MSLLFANGAFAVDNVVSKDAPDLASPRAKIKAKEFKAAIDELTPMLATNQHPDIYNLMGFSLRKSGDMKQAATFYAKALDFDPDHKGALEYQGEMFVELGQIDKAKVNLARTRGALSAGLRGARRFGAGDCEGISIAQDQLTWRGYRRIELSRQRRC